TARPSRHGTNHELLGGEEIAAQYAAADLVISQVGPGTIADANRAGHRPIVVPRDPRLGEVVDDHQVAFGEFMAARGRCVSVRTREHLVA
ncbi:glycosyltransferase, partial [Salmonella enterica]|uniref:glycosyltransferase n=1 Tax=Salmonella enterica TaxID=28901 RepID=UPI003CF197E7